MTTRKQIILAVANGCTFTRQVAKRLEKPLRTINNYFYKKNSPGVLRFTNGLLLKWTPGKARTLQLGPRAAITRGSDGIAKDVGVVADMEDLEASFNERCD